jgi:hypothetical protein
MTVLGDADEGGRLRFFRQFVQAIPIPRPTSQTKHRLSELARRCTEEEGSDCESWERQIDEEVAALYGIDSPPSVEGSSSRSRSARPRNTRATRSH